MLHVGGIEVGAISRNDQAIDLAELMSVGVDPLHCATIALKSALISVRRSN
ncbi:hypothetical protein JQK88_34935 [Mesorhizobium caraganae]|uniref:hypothetical protein n=1 Tax=Mesorhizobium caraganae TaxID=483206 RepID=UPI001939C3E5|nr:hypothetical protein [Mesorhizobium caraganae]MBM2716263.1 hypothetical protein [Mesorhizobium caraganae]